MKYLLLAFLFVILLIGGCVQEESKGPKNETKIIECPSVIDFVCGDDGITYNNSCIAEKAGVKSFENGACKPTCLDSDSENTQIAGRVSLRTATYSDVCINSTSVREFVCSDGAVKELSMQCGQNFTCTEGKCVPKPEEKPKPPLCIDSDGNDVETIGTVSIQTKNYTDSCVGLSQVREYICTDSNYSSSIITCPEGYACQNGRCTTEPFSCTDAEGAKDLYENGIVIVDYGTRKATYEDICGSNATVVDYFCDGKKFASEEVSCPYGSLCFDGKCTASCDDDDGEDDHTAGIVTVTSPSGETTMYRDRCYDSVEVLEYLCYQGNAITKRISCASNICRSGACVRFITTE